MKLSILAIATSFAALFGSSFCNAQTTITFEELPLGGSGFYNGVTTTQQQLNGSVKECLLVTITTRGDLMVGPIATIPTLQLRDLEINIPLSREVVQLEAEELRQDRPMPLHTAITTWPDSRFLVFHY